MWRTLKCFFGAHDFMPLSCWTPNGDLLFVKCPHCEKIGNGVLSNGQPVPASMVQEAVKRAQNRGEYE